MTIPREGIFYRTRDGHKVGPMVPDNGERYGAEWPWRVPEEGGPPFMDFAPAWRLDGTFHATPGARHPYDLVAEWVDEPAAPIPELMQDLAVTEGVKQDGGKPPLHLIAPDFLYAVADILDFGAKKYAPRNWEKGMGWSRVYRAAIGHLFDWFMRKGPDPETGKSHLWHAACCIMFLVCYEIRDTGTDDRPYLTVDKLTD